MLQIHYVFKMVDSVVRCCNNFDDIDGAYDLLNRLNDADALRLCDYFGLNPVWLDAYWRNKLPRATVFR